MAPRTRVELVVGAGPRWRAVFVGAWSLTAAWLFWAAERLPEPLVLAGLALWLSEAVNLRAGRWRLRALTVHRDGGAELDGRPGAWEARGWSTRWLTVLRVRSGDRFRRVAVWSRHNPPAACRTLRVWLRHPPPRAGNEFADGLSKDGLPGASGH